MILKPFSACLSPPPPHKPPELVGGFGSIICSPVFACQIKSGKAARECCRGRVVVEEVIVIPRGITRSEPKGNYPRHWSKEAHEGPSGSALVWEKVLAALSPPFFSFKGGSP